MKRSKRKNKATKSSDAGVNSAAAGQYKPKKIEVERMSRKIVFSFVRSNIIAFAVLVFFYLFLTLLVYQSDQIKNLFIEFISTTWGQDGIYFVRQYPFLIVLVVYVFIFICICIYYSVITLYNFDKTCRSLSNILVDDAKIKKFSKNFSGLEISLKDIKNEIFRSQQVAVLSEARKNDLVMYLAHDLKTPLTSIIGYLSLLDEAPDLPMAQRAKYIDITLEKAYRLEQLINEFFEITRFNMQKITLQRNRIDLGMMLNQIAEEFYPMFKEKNLDFDIDIDRKIIMFADADKIARVFDNLLKNAVSYCYENTTIHIGARVVGRKVIIKFRNQCDEIPQEKIDQLFDKFFRLDSSRTSKTGGSGLGLAISKQIVEMHLGKITVQSTPEYTDFTVILPFEDADYVLNIDTSFTQPVNRKTY